MHHPAYQNQYHQQPDWQHLPQAPHNQYAAQTQAAAAANAAAQQQNYGRTMSAAGQHGGNTNPLANATNGAGNGINNNGGPLGGSGGPGDHNGGSIIGPGDNITEDNRRVLEWIAQVLNANTREAALLELSKKREQVPELALILWHSFGMLCEEEAGSARQLTTGRRHDVPPAGDHLRVPSAEPIAAHCSCFEQSMQRPGAASMCRIA